MPITKNRGAIKKFSGGVWKLLPIADEVAGPASTDTGWLDLGYVEESTLSDSTETEDIKDETGGVVNTDEVERTVKINGLVMQTDKETVDFFKETVRGKYYFVYHYDGINDSKHQEYFFGICQVKPMVEIASGTKRIPFEISVLKNDSDIGVGDSGEVALGSWAKDYDTGAGDGTLNTPFDISAGTYYELTETNV